MHRNVFQKRKNFSRRVSCASKLARLRVVFFLFLILFPLGLVFYLRFCYLLLLGFAFLAYDALFA